MEIEVLGPGCKRCDQLYDNTVAAVSALASPDAVTVKKIKDIQYFTRMGVFMTPALVIDGEVIAVGKVLTAEQIRAKILERMSR